MANLGMKYYLLLKKFCQKQYTLLPPLPGPWRLCKKRWNRGRRNKLKNKMAIFDLIFMYNARTVYEAPIKEPIHDFF